MLQKTKGIVLNYIKYKESSIIVHIYTREYGLRSYIENGVRSLRSKNKVALFQPLTLLDMVVFENEQKAIKRLSEIKCYLPYRNLPTDIRKASIGIFLAEILKKTMKEEQGHGQLYDFLEQSFVYLDECAQPENFHLVFLVHLMRFLGFDPGQSFTIIEEFRAVNLRPFSAETYQWLNQILVANFNTSLVLSRKQRIELLDVLLSFYRLHVADFGQVRSLQILSEVLD
jgi:DNA repair protein RecO (recombination protein O)